MRKITIDAIEEFRCYLIREEKSKATLEKYIRDIQAFYSWSKGSELSKEKVLEYKQFLIGTYATASVNSMLSSLNSFFVFLGWHDLRAHLIKIQKVLFIDSENELTKTEYKNLLKTAQKGKNERLYLLMQTICSTGIRVSELKSITIEAVNSRKATINLKGKLRIVIIPDELCKMLIQYSQKHGVKSGPVFVTKNGRPIDRSNIWRLMKSLGHEAGVPEKKIFPHNLRHLFARTFYSLEKDIVRLADVLGHSNINTTRIYTLENGDIHRSKIQRLGLLKC